MENEQVMGGEGSGMGHHPETASRKGNSAQKEVAWQAKKANNIYIRKEYKW